MNKIKFMKELRMYLEQAYGKLERNEINVVMSDYEEFFREGQSENKTEDEIVQSLGNPKDIVDEIVRNDIEDGKYTQEEFFQYFYPNTENDKSTIGERIRDIDGDTIINGAQKTATGIIQFILIIALFFFDVIYFPIVFGIVMGVIGIAIGGIFTIPALASGMSVVGVFSLFAIFPALFFMGLVGLLLTGAYYLFKLGFYVNKYVFRFIRGGRI